MHAAMVKLRGVLVTTIYHKMFTLEQWQLTDAAAVTLMTNDADAAQSAIPYLVKLMAALPDLACGMGLLYYLIGNVAFYSLVPALCESFIILPPALISRPNHSLSCLCILNICRISVDPCPRSIRTEGRGTSQLHLKHYSATQEH